VTVTGVSIDPDVLFAAEWTRADDGVYERTSARVVIVDSARRVLLMRALEGDHSWWFTIGGGIAPGEDDRAAAVREAFEETGIRLDPQDLVGPISRRLPSFTFLGRPCRQDERLYLAEVSSGVETTTGGWTDLELATWDGLHWWPLAELLGTTEVVYPPGLGERISSILDHGWDGTTPKTD
jgi:8-oxo-dGTP pyrophosphatase MutT (NUDIX family)